ncbi:MAG TPA: LapA family protein [Nitrospiria bacterium]|jgi:uncharacterized membrane protein YciS (DUF1049 family)
MMVRFVFVLIFVIVIFTFAIKNLEKTITFHYFFGYESSPFPVYLVILGVFFFGMMMTVILLLPEWVKNRIRIRRHERTLQRLETELNQRHSISKSEKKGESFFDEETQEF